jgi:tetratricopeptide (TPR) repeat protein
MSRGRFDQAIAEAQTAVSLAPPNAPPTTDLAEILCAAHRYDEALGEARRVVEETGGDPAARVALGVCLAAEGRYDEAIAEYQVAIRGSLSAYAMARLGNAYGAKGDRIAAYAILTRLDEYFERTLSIYWSYRGMVYAGLGEGMRAVDSLEKAFGEREGDINFIGVDPAYDRVRNQGAFVLLRSRLGLP